MQISCYKNKRINKNESLTLLNQVVKYQSNSHIDWPDIAEPGG